MEAALRPLLVFAVGGIAYGTIEMLYRRYTHWTMILAGGLAFALLYLAYTTFAAGWSIWLKALLGSGVITGIELAVGAGFNLGLGWRIWDYSGQPLNFKGQICLLYSGLWYLLSLPIAWISAYLYRIWF